MSGSLQTPTPTPVWEASYFKRMPTGGTVYVSDVRAPAREGEDAGGE